MKFRMKPTPFGKEPSDVVLDAKPYVQHHSRVGYSYIPNTKMILPQPGGGSYHICINSQGIRSDKEYSTRKRDGIYRILVFGDSFAAGQYVNNQDRFSEILERRNPGLEVINLGLEGTGTDQQLLIFEERCKTFEFDMVLLFPFLQNIKRNVVDYRESIDPLTRKRVLIPKPRFELINGELILRNVPISQDRKIIPDEDSRDQSMKTDTPNSWKGKCKSSLNRIIERLGIKSAIYSLIPWEPFPEYAHPQTKEWLLMEAIIRDFKKIAREKYLVVVPLFYASYIRYRMARNYWTRFSSLSDSDKLTVLDALPYFKRLGTDGVKCFFEPFDCHFSPHGHLVLANFLEIELKKMIKI